MVSQKRTCIHAAELQVCTTSRPYLGSCDRRVSTRCRRSTGRHEGLLRAPLPSLRQLHRDDIGLRLLREPRLSQVACLPIQRTVLDKGSCTPFFTAVQLGSSSRAELVFSWASSKFPRSLIALVSGMEATESPSSSPRPILDTVSRERPSLQIRIERHVGDRCASQNHRSNRLFGPTGRVGRHW